MAPINEKTTADFRSNEIWKAIPAKAVELLALEDDPDALLTVFDPV